jgi:hypothetical protein
LDSFTFLLVSAVVLAVCYFGGHILLSLRAPPVQPPLLALLVIALFARLYFLTHFPRPFGDFAWDADSYKIVADLVGAGKDVYANTDRHPYLPFHMYIFAASDWLSKHAVIGFFSWVRIPNIAADLGITALIYRGSLRLGRSASAAFWLAFLWAVNPISILTSVIHGQFDSVPLFFTLLAWYLLRMWQQNRYGAALGGLSMGLAVLDKSWPVLFVPVLLLVAPRMRDKVAYLVATAAVPLFFVGLYYVLYSPSIDTLETRVLDYNAVAGRWGYPLLFDKWGAASPSWMEWAREHGRTATLWTIAVVGAFVVPRREAMASCAALVAAFYAATSGFGSQYLVWIVPLALMAGETTMLAIYSLFAVSALYILYWGTGGLVYKLTPTREYWPLLIAWPFTVLWMFREIAVSIPLKQSVAEFRKAMKRPSVSAR